MSVSDRLLDLPRILSLDPSRAADRSAIEAEVLLLFDGFRDPLLRYVTSIGLSPGDGEDVVQDVFLALFTHLRRGGGRANLRGWLFRVAHNLALKKRMQRQRELGRHAGSEEAARRVLDPARDPEEAMAERERRRRTSAVLQALPERDRQCVALRGHGFRYREIADILGVSLGTVAKSMARAIARLQRATGV